MLYYFLDHLAIAEVLIMLPDISIKTIGLARNSIELEFNTVDPVEGINFLEFYVEIAATQSWVRSVELDPAIYPTHRFYDLNPETKFNFKIVSHYGDGTTHGQQYSEKTL